MFSKVSIILLCLGADCCGGALWYNQQWLSDQEWGHMQDTGEFEAYSVVLRKEKPNCFQCSFINLLFSFVCKDIDSDRPMMQVGPYVFAGEYEGEKSCKMKKIQTACTCCVCILRGYLFMLMSFLSSKESFLVWYLINYYRLFVLEI